MPKFKLGFLALLLLIIAIPSAVFASSFSQAQVRLDDTSSGASLSGKVCATPSSANAGTENKIEIHFPSSFNISSGLSNWSTSTTNLGSGETAWPGIGSNASSINSKTVAFSSSDLTSGSATYCFNFSGSGSNTGSSGNDLNGTLVTKNSSGSTIDSSAFAVSIGGGNQVNVSATVPAQASDFPVSIAQVTSGDNFPPGEVIEYKITYGSNLAYASNIKVEAQWYSGDSDDGSNPDVVDYSPGSATDAYNSTSPVIDTVNKKISWNIASFPGNTTGQSVNFKLKTNSSYTNGYQVTFKVAGRIYGPGVTTPDQSVNSTYKYPYSSSNPTPTPTQAPTNDTNSPSPTPVAQQTSINLIEIRTISQSDANIYVSTTPGTKTIIKYGTKPTLLDKSVSNSSLAEQKFITLKDLNPATIYYFIVYATDASGRTQTSDTYTFKTASAPPPIVDLGNLSISSSDNAVSLYDGSENTATNTQANVAIPQSTVFKFRFNINNASSVSKVQAFIRNKNVLGISFPTQALADTEVTDVIEISPGVWEGTLQTNNLKGNYELYARITDTKGNITEQKISDVKVVNKFTIVSANDDKPIEGARVLIYIYSPTTKKYIRIPSANLTGGNPQFTDSNGKLNLVLPLGKYKADITNLNYKDQTILFQINSNSDYPIIKMQSTGITPLRLIRYYFRTFNDVLVYNTQIYAGILMGSTRYFDLVAAVIVGSFVFLALLAFSKKHRIPIVYLGLYFYYLLDHDGNKNKYVEGVVYDEHDKPIPGANVYLSDSESEEIISRGKTNVRGEFFFRRVASSKDKYFLMVMCKNYKTSPLIPYEAKEHIHMKITLEKEHEGINLLENVGKVFSEALGISFEAIMAIAVITEVLFVINFGFLKALPFLALSIYNLSLWILVIRHRNHFEV